MLIFKIAQSSGCYLHELLMNIQQFTDLQYLDSVDDVQQAALKAEKILVGASNESLLLWSLAECLSLFLHLKLLLRG